VVQKMEGGTFTPPGISSDSDYNPGMSQVLVNQEGEFQGNLSEVVIPYDYG